MRPEPNFRIEYFRKRHPVLGDSPLGMDWGFFISGPLRIISSGIPGSGEPPWEHVSISCADRCPTWEEMQYVKELFWDDTETVLQFHPRCNKYKNLHPFTLHLWKRAGKDHELPPSELIAP